MSVGTYIPSRANSVAVTPVARTLSVEADWISVAMVPMVTMFTCAGEGVRKISEETEQISGRNFTLSTLKSLLVLFTIAVSHY